MQEALPHLAEGPNYWHQLPRVWLFLGEVDEANAICDEMLRRFGDTEDPAVAHDLSSVCLAVPGREVTDQVQRLAELSATVPNPTHFRDMGMLCYRRGEYDEAERWLTRGTVYLRGRPATLYYLAMARHKRGDEAGARDAFREAQRCREQIRQNFPDGGFDDLWHQWLLLEAIRREAEEVMRAGR